MAGVVTYDTIAKLIAYEGRSELLLKWPNDILLAGEKLAGMLSYVEAIPMDVLKAGVPWGWETFP